MKRIWAYLFLFVLGPTLLLKGQTTNQNLMDSLVFSSIQDDDYQELEHLLKTKKIDINNIFTKEKETPLHYAVFLGKDKAVRILLKGGANINSLTPKGYTPLHLAAQEGYSIIAELLLTEGASKVLLNYDGYTPLHLAASFGKIQVVKLLGKEKKEIDIKGKDNVTPLQLASQNGHADIVEYLLSMKANPNFSAKGSHGHSLHFAVHGNHPEIVELLIKNGALVNQQNDTGDTPFVWNGYIGNIKIAQILLAHGADPQIITFRFLYNALHTASIRGKTDLVDFFLKEGIYTSKERSQLQMLPLHYAALYGHLKTLEVLLNAYPQAIDTVEKEGKTPLHLAVGSSQKDIVSFLISQKANTAIKDKQGETPLDIAKRIGKQEIIDLLG